MSETCWKQQKTKEIMHTPFSLTHFDEKVCTVVSTADMRHCIKCCRYGYVYFK